MPVICRDLKLLFLCVPKTGCTAIANVLIQHYGGEWLPEHDVYSASGELVCHTKHSTVRELVQAGCLSQEEVDELYIVGGTRHPVSWLLSNYYFAIDSYKRYGEETTEEWVRRNLEMYRFASTNNFDAFVRAYWPPDGQTVSWVHLQDVDYVIRQEQLQVGFDTMMAHVGAETRIIPLDNITWERVHASNVCNLPTASYIAAAFSKDFDRFGYSLDESVSQDSVATSMNVYSVVWARSPEYVKHQLALKQRAAAQRNKGVFCRIDVLVIDGFEHFSGVIEELRELDCHVHDKSSVFQGLVERYRNLWVHYEPLIIGSYDGDFFFKNLMRWLVCAEHASGHPFLHIDADLVLNEDPRKLATDFHGKGFYASSTCFVFVRDSSAFAAAYASDLDRLDRDPSGFSREIGITARTRQTAEWDLHAVESLTDLDEEKFFCFHIHEHPLSWARPDNSEYVYIPFVVHTYGPHNGVGGTASALPIAYDWRNRVHYWNGKRMAYMHYQRRFADILGVHTAQAMLGVTAECRWCMRPVAWPANSRETGVDHLVASLVSFNSGLTVHGKDPFSYETIISTYELWGLSEVFVNYFWHAKGAFR
ncbi:sulfotransferase family 2 domain-containing protein (plasmid) [Ensifer sp. PDNC004]|uniref:sulfotransferase family 2 domain-containing protein n=1 Tax=Ensifer sp. PDNC004 TaxID=2811423 RepID=UPI00196528EE|nr:sulfotransferase family 2 domain-containing protein [Ensifer sp. PDNC004]QRY65486.1 sulfotransferase family 2 domain-containing protein [Ensifer sp. PDNC004]